MWKYISLAAAFAFVAIVSYKGLQDDGQIGEVTVNVSEKSTPEPEITHPLPAKQEIEAERKQEEVKIPEKRAMPESKPETIEKKVSDNEEMSDPDDEEEDDTPTVKRSQLIGGADVEWIEPKPRSPDDKFGEPPRI